MVINWLDLLIAGTTESEAPERWFWWSGISALAATVKKNVYLDRHYYRLYPNVYVALISAQPGQRKGIPISICKGILEATDQVRVISGCNSIQGLIHDLSMQKTFESGLVTSDAQAILVSDEFSTFLTEDARSLKDLIALYNPWEHEKNWVKTLKGTGVETLKQPCLNMLVASNQTLFDQAVKASDRDGGFISRTFIVYEREDRLYNSLVTAPKHKLDKEGLAEGLKRIATIKGEFKFTEAGGKYYDEWYQKFRRMSAGLEDSTGTLGRFGDAILKVAMLMSLAKTDNLLITEQLLNDAILKCESCLPAVKITGLTGNIGEISEGIAKVMRLLLEAPDQTMGRHRLLQKLNLKGVDSIVLDRVIESLTQAGALERPTRDEKNRLHYKLKKEVYDQYMGTLKDLKELE